MSSKTKIGNILLDIKDLKIQGFADEKWHDIINVSIFLFAGAK